MRNVLWLLLLLVALYLGAQAVLHLVYGPSYPFLPSANTWLPDGNADWVTHGTPDKPKPSVPSVTVPIWVRYIPIFLPGIVLILFLFTPLRRKLDDVDDGLVEVEIEDEGSEADESPDNSKDS